MTQTSSTYRYQTFNGTAWETIDSEQTDATDATGMAREAAYNSGAREGVEVRVTLTGPDGTLLSEDYFTGTDDTQEY